MSLNQVFSERNQTEAAGRITRQLRRNVFGTYTGVGLVPRIRITPNQREKRNLKEPIFPNVRHLR